MKPTEAGFDGEKGLNLNFPSLKAVYKLRRGKKPPEPDKHNLKNQLLWYYPEGSEAKLLYCNNNNELFELEFIPVML